MNDSLNKEHFASLARNQMQNSSSLIAFQNRILANSGVFEPVGDKAFSGFTQWEVDLMAGKHPPEFQGMLTNHVERLYNIIGYLRLVIDSQGNSILRSKQEITELWEAVHKLQKGSKK